MAIQGNKPCPVHAQLSSAAVAVAATTIVHDQQLASAPSLLSPEHEHIYPALLKQSQFYLHSRMGYMPVCLHDTHACLH